MVSNVAAAAHAAVRRSVSPKLFNFDSFTELSNPRDLAKIFECGRIRRRGSRSGNPRIRGYVALAMPRVLARLPYGQEFKRGRGVQLRGDRRRQGARQVLCG